MKTKYKVLILGASYGSLFSTKLLLAGHAVTLVCTKSTAELINRDGTFVRLPIRDRKTPIEISSKASGADILACPPNAVDPGNFDLIVFAMQEPQYGSDGVRELIERIAKARVPCLAIMNMPPLPFLKRIVGLSTDGLSRCYADPSVWDGFEPGLVTLASPDPQAFRPPEEGKNVLQVGLPTNFKVARFESEAHTAMLRRLQADIEAIRFDPGDGAIELPVKLKVHDSLFVPLAKWLMLLTGNYRCIQRDKMIPIKEAVHSDFDVSREIYNWVGKLCKHLGATDDDLVPFEKYAEAAKGLLKPSSVARALFEGAKRIERVDLLVQQIALHRGLRYKPIDEIVTLVNHRRQSIKANLQQYSDLTQLFHNSRRQLMAGRNFLFVPGPTNVPDRVLRAMVVAMEDHRSSKFPELTLTLFPDLKKVFKAWNGQVFIFPSTGTGAWEAALANTLSPGDKVLAPRFGQFSHLWIDMMKRLGLDVEVIEVEWGEGAPVEVIARALEADQARQIKGVMIVHNETATGVTSDIAAVRKAMNDVGHPALLYVDAVSSLGSIDFRMSEWGVDLAVTGSQKGLMLPAGLGIVCAGEKALQAAKTAKCPRAFFDFADMQRANADGYFPYTPALSLLYGLRESLDIIFAEGLDHVIERHKRLASGVREAVAAWELKTCCKHPRWHSDTVTAVMVPQGINGAHVIDVAFRRYNLALGAGLSQMAGRLFRLGHLGDLNELMLLGALAGTEMAMADVGIPIKLGSGVAAAQDYWRRTDPVPKKRVAHSEVVYASHSTGSLNA